MIHGTMTISSKNDYLSILGLSYDFDDVELKKAFRREARKWHPDLNKNDINAEERFKLINEAYDFLRDPQKRDKSVENNFKNEQEKSNFKTGFPYFEDYLNSLFGYEDYSNSYNDSIENNINDDSIYSEEESENYDYPATSPEEPPPAPQPMALAHSWLAAGDYSRTGHRYVGPYGPP